MQESVNENVLDRRLAAASAGSDGLDQRLVEDAGRERRREQRHEIQTNHPVAAGRRLSEIDRLQRRCAAGDENLKRIAL